MIHVSITGLKLQPLIPAAAFFWPELWSLREAQSAAGSTRP
jgi:hypothetical protein